MFFKLLLLIVCAGVAFPGYAQSVVDSAGPMLKYVDEPSGVAPKNVDVKDTAKPAAPVEKTAAVPQEDSSSSSAAVGRIVNIDDEDADDDEDDDDEDKDDDTSKSDSTAGKTVKERIVDGMLVAKQLMDRNSKVGEKISKSRIQGYGGAVSVSPMVFALRMKPVKELIQGNTELRKYSFPDLDKGYFPILVVTVMPYGGVGNGRRIGFAGVGGKVFLEGNQIGGDSMAVVSVKVSSGGFLFEKARVHNKLNLITGGVLSWGSIEVTKAFQDGSAFKSSWNFNTEKNEPSAKASFLGLEMHAGGTYTVLPWMHIGIDANALLMMSVNGFGWGNGGFVNVNPGLRLRIVLGNLG